MRHKEKRSDLRRLGGNILGQLGRLDMSQKALAAKLGLHKNTIYEYTSGRVEMGATTLKRIALALGCSCDELLEGVGE